MNPHIGRKVPFKLEYSWYFYDLPKRVIGYSQGGYIAPFVWRSLKEYFQCIYGFVEKVMSQVEVFDESILRWASHFSKYVPGFPDSNTIFESNHLVSAITTFIFNVSVFHSADSINRAPLRLRFPPPTSIDVPPLDKKNGIFAQDIFRYFLANEMFFRDFPISRLTHVDYGFESVVSERSD